MSNNTKNNNIVFANKASLISLAQGLSIEPESSTNNIGPSKKNKLCDTGCLAYGATTHKVAYSK